MKTSFLPIFPTLIGTGAFNDDERRQHRLSLQKAMDMDTADKNLVTNTINSDLQHSLCPNKHDDDGLNASPGIREHLRSLIDLFTEDMQEFAPQFFGIDKERANWFCNTAWYNISTSGGFQYRHNHVNSFLTVVYYFDLPENCVGTMLHRPAIDTRPVFGFEPDRYHEGNFEYCVPKMIEGSYMIFPSHLVHEAPTNGEMDRPRISFSMNFIPDRIDCSSYILKLK